MAIFNCKLLVHQRVTGEARIVGGVSDNVAYRRITDFNW